MTHPTPPSARPLLSPRLLSLLIASALMLPAAGCDVPSPGGDGQGGAGGAGAGGGGAGGAGAGGAGAGGAAGAGAGAAAGGPDDVADGAITIIEEWQANGGSAGGGGRGRAPVAGKLAPMGAAGAPTDGVVDAADNEPAPDPLAEGLHYRLSSTDPAAPGGTDRPFVHARPLTGADADALLARLPLLPSLTGDVRDFAFRERTLPAPRPGLTIDQPFPPAGDGPPPVEVSTLPLTVLRTAPVGKVPLASHLTVAFSHAMVALDRLDALNADGIVELEPAVAGRWRWVDTRTLAFEPEGGRFPAATQYRATVPFGVQAQVGAELRDVESWSFTTPPPTLLSSRPRGGPTVRDPVMVVTFDQRVDPAAVIGKVALRGDGRVWPVRALTADEVRAERQPGGALASVIGNADGKWVAFRATQTLPGATTFRVVLPVGLPSAEGPLTTELDQEFSFTTYGPFEVTGVSCGHNWDCRPGSAFRIEFSNPIDPKSLTSDLLEVVPAVEEMVAWVSGSSLYLRGRTLADTEYAVTLSPGLRDIFGQVSDRIGHFKFPVGEAQRPYPWFSLPGQMFVVLDPYGDATFPVHAVNYERIDLELWDVQPEQWGDFINDHDFWGEVVKGGQPEPPGRRVWSKSFDLEDARDEWFSHRVDLTPALGAGGLGHALLVMRPMDPSPSNKHFRPRSQYRWIQRGGAAVDALADQTELVAWATSLSDGRPLAGASVRLMPDGATAVADDNGLARLPLPVGGGPGFRWLQVTPRTEPGAGREADAGAGAGASDAEPVTTILPEGTYPMYRQGRSSSWQKRMPARRALWHVFDDRGMYRPGERVHLAGWIRIWDGREGGDTEPFTPAGGEVSWIARDARNNEVAKGTASLSGRGGFDLAFDLPDNLNLGNARVELQLPSGTDAASGTVFHHSLQVQEFRRPEYEVTVEAGEGPHLIGGAAEVSVEAAYYAGGPLPGADVAWTATASPGHYRPPGRDEFVFGEWTPWWGWHERVVYSGNSVGGQTLAATTDASGRHDVRIDFDSAVPARPHQLRIEGAVTDVNRQRWADATELLVHASSTYVGLQAERTFVQQGELLRLSVIATDIDGAAEAGRTIALRAWRTRWVNEAGQWTEVEADLQEQTVTAGAEPVDIAFEGRNGGRWFVQAEVQDDAERTNRTRLMLWVAGGESKPSSEGVEQQTVQLIPDRETYAPGDTAQILVQSPFADGFAVVRLQRSGTLSVQRLALDNGSATLTVPITEAHLPNLHVRVDVVGSEPRRDEAGTLLPDAPPKPAYATGALDLRVPPLTRALDVTVTPRDTELNPGASTSVDLVVNDASGEPLSEGEAVVVVVDEAVLALSGYQLLDPLLTFYPDRSPDSWEALLRRFVLLAKPGLFDEDVDGQGGQGDDDGRVDEMMENARSRSGGEPFAYDMFGGDVAAEGSLAMKAPAMKQLQQLGYVEGASGGPAAPAVQPRTNFDALAVFATRVPVADGRAEVALELPDNLTRYRVMAVVVDRGRLFGKGEASITARLPLMVRPSAPRFLNFGDVFELPVVLQNGTDEDMEVGLALRASNADLRAGAAWRVTVPASDRVEVRVPAAAMRPGTARFSILAAASDDTDGSRADAARIELPVWTPATTEAFAIHGTLDEGAVLQSVIAPSDVVPDWGGLELTTSSTALAALTDAFLYVYDYPYGCAEQVASRVLSVATLREVLAAFEADGLPAPEAIERSMAADIAKLASLQNSDGGWGYWRRDGDSIPYLSVHVALALQTAAAHGYEVPDNVSARARSYLADIRSRFPHWYGEDLRIAIECFALNVQARMGHANAARARGLLNEVGLDALPLEAAGWLLGVFAAAPDGSDEVGTLLRHLVNRASETAGAAHFTSRYGADAHVLLHSERRTDGVILDALLDARPDHDLVPKVVAGLMAHKQRGRWGNTQENAFILLALKHYFDRFEADDPDFVARAWLGERYAAETAYRGRSTDRNKVTIPMRELRGTADDPEPMVIAKDGPGRLYYRLGLSYAPSDLDLAPADHGFEVERRYEAIEDEGDVELQSDGTWRIKLGAPVRVHVTMVARSSRAHVALVDPLPAGLEPMNPALAVTGSLPTGPADASGDDGPMGGMFRPWWNWPWYEHQNLRDERVEAFRSWLPAGVYSYEYVARATTPGVFIVPPAKAEEMYTPETFGRSGSDIVVVD